MVQLLRPRLSSLTTTHSPQKERQELQRSLHHTRALIQQAYSSFNSTCDTDLIESYVFEINALQSRYNYLLRRFKELEEFS